MYIVALSTPTSCTHYEPVQKNIDQIFGKGNVNCASIFVSLQIS